MYRFLLFLAAFFVTSTVALVLSVWLFEVIRSMWHATFSVNSELFWSYVIALGVGVLVGTKAIKEE